MSATPVTVEGRVGLVVIGRNEGERLRRCLLSLQGSRHTVVYVDSASTDGSVELARSLGADVVPLDMSTPFTAARARNAGFRRLLEIDPQVDVVQFIDGDCELIDGWLDTAQAFLKGRPEVACVCGRLRERHPERSVYNRLCEVEWDRPAGQTDACGGIAMMRRALFAQAQGFREDLLAGEEPELCARLRAQGFTIWRLADHMAWHDAAMVRFGQWWTRSKRSGFGFAQTLWIGGLRSQPAQTRRAAAAWIWAGAIPMLIVAAAFVVGWPALLGLLLYPIQMLRVARHVNAPPRLKAERAFFLVIGRFPELAGQWQFWRTGRHGRATSPSFDYKA
jgi:GT2 family glycosyltransferase